MKKSYPFIILFCLLVISCDKPKSLENEPDGTIKGNVIPGEAAGRSGLIRIVASHTNAWDGIDWNINGITLSTFGPYEIKELIAGKYYIIVHLDENKDGTMNSGEAWGGHDTNGDKRLDTVTLIGGNTLNVDVRCFSFY